MRLGLPYSRLAPLTPSTANGHFFRFDCVKPGYGYAITTYDSDGDPLPSFAGVPYLLPLADAPTGLWEALNPEHRIALAVRRIAADGAVETEIINRYEAV